MISEHLFFQPELRSTAQECKLPRIDCRNWIGKKIARCAGKQHPILFKSRQNQRAVQGAHVAPEKPASNKGARKKKGAPKTPRGAKSKKPAKAPAKKGASDPSNKKAEVIALMKRAKGVTLAEIVEATGWQNHTIRGFVSILGSKGGEKIESTKNASGERTYRIER